MAVLKKGCYYPFAQVAVRTVLDAGFGIERLCSRKRADNEVDAARVRRNRRPAPLFDFDGSAVHLEAHIVEIRVVDVNGYIEIVGVGESRRIVAYGLVLLAETRHLVDALVDIVSASRDIGKLEHIGVRFRVIARRGNHEAACVFVDKNLGGFTER